MIRKCYQYTWTWLIDRRVCVVDVHSAFGMNPTASLKGNILQAYSSVIISQIISIVFHKFSSVTLKPNDTKWIYVDTSISTCGSLTKEITWVKRSVHDAFVMWCYTLKSWTYKLETLVHVHGALMMCRWGMSHTVYTLQYIHNVRSIKVNPIPNSYLPVDSPQ